MFSSELPLTQQMYELGLLYIAEYQKLNDGKFPKGHTEIPSLKLGMYIGADKHALEPDNTYYMIKAAGLSVNICGHVERLNWDTLDTYALYDIYHLFQRIHEALATGVSMEKYTFVDFEVKVNQKERVITNTNTVIKEVDNPTHKTKADLLDKLLFSKELIIHDCNH